jgi:hypothetical protein
MKSSTTHGFVNQLMIYTLVMIGFSGSIGLGTVWMRHQISLTANSTRLLAARIAETERRLAETSTAAETERDTNLLLQRNLDWHLGLVPPSREQIVHVVEDPVRHLAAKRDRGIYGDSAASVTVSLPLTPAARR